MDPDLPDAAIVNESRNAEVVGDVSLFESLESLASWAEPVDVRNHAYFAYTLSGHGLDLGVENDRVIVVKVGADDVFSTHVRRLLEVTAERVLKARRQDHLNDIRPGPLTIRELADLIGFTR
jgi:hypothetical protein